MLDRRGFVGSLLTFVASLFGLDKKAESKTVRIAKFQKELLEFAEPASNMLDPRWPFVRKSRRLKTQIEPLIVIHKASGRILDQARIKWVFGPHGYRNGSLSHYVCSYRLDVYEQISLPCDYAIITRVAEWGDDRITVVGMKERKDTYALLRHDDLVVLHGADQASLELDMEIGAFTVNELRDRIGLPAVQDERGEKVCWWYEDLLGCRVVG